MDRQVIGIVIGLIVFSTPCLLYFSWLARIRGAQFARCAFLFAVIVNVVLFWMLA